MTAATSSQPQDRAELKLGDALHGGWASLSVNRSVEQCAGGFTLGLTGADVWRHTRPGDPCQVLLGGEPVITGYVDEVGVNFDGRTHDIRVSGRDKTGDLVDCSAVHRSGQWRRAGLDVIARDLLAPYGIALQVDTDVGAVFPSHKIEPGETVLECLERAARLRAVLLTSDPLGRLVITRAGAELIPPQLVEGVNILSAAGTFSWKDRYSRYTLMGQAKIGPDGEFEAAHVSPSATVMDPAIDRHRPLVVLAEDHSHGPALSQRAAWERSVRQGRGNRAEITVQGWRRPDGPLWAPNTLVRVVSPTLKISADLLIVGCAWQLAEGGTTTKLTLARREAFELLGGIGRSRLQARLNDKTQKDKKKRGDDWSDF